MKACTQCGKCCQNYADGGLSASAEEIEQWELHRPDIAAYVADGAIWVAPDTGEPLKHCPWLTSVEGSGPVRYACSIYADRPLDCRAYPVSLGDMRRDECEMLELKDLDDLVKAQTALDRLMGDSRPTGAR